MTRQFNLISKIFFIYALSWLMLISCNSSLNYKHTLKINPSGNAPLTALLAIQSSQKCKVKITVLGNIPIHKEFNELSDSHEIPIVGLYPNTTNKVLLQLSSGSELLQDTIFIETANIPDHFPTISIANLQEDNMEKGFHLCDLHFANYGSFNSMPTIFDNAGTIRWYLDLSSFGKILYPISRLSNGNYILGGKNQIIEYDILGRKVNQHTLDKKYKVHHEIVEVLDEKLLVAIGRDDVTIELDGKSVTSQMDHVLLYNTKTGSIEKEWDLAKYLDVSRDDLNILDKSDWIHINGLAFSEKDSMIYVSSKNQGLIKINWENELEWILSANKNWGQGGRTGNGAETEPYLLTAIDKQGKRFANSIQNGDANAEEFEFPWGMHAPLIMENGNIMLFDNGYKRNFAFDEKAYYSRAVEYLVNDEDKTVQQVWQFGKRYGPLLYSMLLSDVDHLPQTDNILVTYGNINKYAKILEVDYETSDIVFEASLQFKTYKGTNEFAWGQLDMLYRSERIENIYP